MRCTEHNINFPMKMNSLQRIKTEQVQFHIPTEMSEPRKRQKRIISRKTQVIEKSAEARKALNRSVKVTQFTPVPSSPHNSRTPQSKHNKVDPTPRRSFHQSSFAITYLPIWKNRQGSDVNAQSARQLPLKQAHTQRQGPHKSDELQKKIQNLKAQLALRTQELEVYEQDRCRLQRNNQLLEKTVASLSSDIKQLRNNIESLKQENLKTVSEKRKLERQKQTLQKKVSALEKCSTSESWSLQSNRERYLERQIQQLKQRQGKSKSELEKLLENELQRHKQELFNSLKKISALNINIDCLQKRIHEILKSKAQGKVFTDQDYSNLQRKYSNLLNQIRKLRNENDRVCRQNQVLRRSFENQTHHPYDSDQDGNWSFNLSD